MKYHLEIQRTFTLHTLCVAVVAHIFLLSLSLDFSGTRSRRARKESLSAHRVLTSVSPAEINNLIKLLYQDIFCYRIIIRNQRRALKTNKMIKLFNCYIIRLK